jgi:calcineurin-like phosphoesterase family protein
MTQTWFGSDFHLGHKNIQKFRKEVDSCEHNIERICDEWGSTVKKRDTIYLLGDICFSQESLEILGKLKGSKVLIRGNHDRFPLSSYEGVFENVYGLFKYKEFWLSHPPVHPQELRNRVNLHGHVHYDTVPDERYFNCCPEALWPVYNRCLVSLDELRVKFKREAELKT